MLEFNSKQFFPNQTVEDFEALILSKLKCPLQGPSNIVTL